MHTRAEIQELVTATLFNRSKWEEVAMCVNSMSEKCS